jgi:hypothetical protein
MVNPFPIRSTSDDSLLPLSFPPKVCEFSKFKKQNTNKSQNAILKFQTPLSFEELAN